jgi:uncharacterized MAPEG superfamily protein
MALYNITGMPIALCLCVGIAFLLIFLPKIPLSIAQARQAGGYDNLNPREQQANLAGWGARARNAHANGFESFPPFAAGVIVAYLGHANERWTTILAVVYLAARTLYPFVYMANLGTLRSLVWGVGFAATAGLFALPLFQ